MADLASRQSRRQFMGAVGGAMARPLLWRIAASSIMLAHGCASDLKAEVARPAPPVLDPADRPEVNSIRLGYIALTDAAPIIVAQEKGYFHKYGMTHVEIVKQASWGSTRDNLARGSATGGIDGAHILTPMPYLMAAGAIPSGEPLAMNILARLNVNGQGISLANIYRSLNVGLHSEALKEAVDHAKTKGPGRWLKVAMTYPGGTHDLWMRYWLAAGGIDPEKDVSMYVVPPPQMVANMKTGTMNMLCVGQPWNEQLSRHKAGYSALTTGQLWLDHPEKALAVRADWVSAYPRAAKATLMAVLEAQMWCDKMQNKAEMCEIIAARRYFNIPAKDIVERVKGNFDFGDGLIANSSDYRMKFWQTSQPGDNASYPYQSHDLWFLTENIRWGKLPPETDMQQLIAQVNREDLWREAATAIGQAAAIPKSTSRGIETFFDGVQFDPAHPTEYLNRLPIKKAIQK